MTRPTDEQLAAWRALADAATEGPWTMSENEDGDDVYFPQWSRYVDAPKPPPGRFHGALAFLGGDEEHGQSKADAAFIAAAREAVPALLDEVARLRAELAALASPPGFDANGSPVE